MTTYYMIRHASHSLLGKTMAGRMPGVPLSEQGLQEAEQLAERMAKVPLEAIYASPLERAQQTAAPLAKRLGLEVHTTDALNEVDFGEWTGMNMDQLHSIPEWAHWNINRSCTRPPRGEMLIEIQNRMVTKMETLRCTHLDGHVALFSHSDTIRAALAFYLGMPADLMWRLEISPASVSVVRLTDARPDILCLNDMADLSLL
jgi:probable phosphoglycerate mutase